MTVVKKKKSTHDKAEEILAELKNLHLLKNTEPAWVRNYEANMERVNDNFTEWLQFVYLPNCLQNKAGTTPSIVPQAMKYFGDDVKKGRLLQLLIELDALV